MNELHWFVQVSYDCYEGKTVRRFWRAYTWQDAHDMIPKQLKDNAYTLFPLEKNGSYYDGLHFVQIDTKILNEKGVL